ncbi:MAG: Xaa-Pro peptidase family protein [archaeon]|jgi:Xaa-Pro aminopeptidase
MHAEEKLWKKVNSVYLRNFLEHWRDPLTSKYVGIGSGNFEGILLLKKNGNPVWISHPFNYSQAKKEFPKNVSVKKFETQKELQKMLEKNLEKKAGYNGKYLSASELKNLQKKFPKKKFIDVSEELIETRQIKSAAEIKNISFAAKETERIFKKIKKTLKKGISEKEVATKIRNRAAASGLETASCIVAFGKNTSHIHHEPNNTKLFSGPVMIDFGLKYNHYCSDITKTFWFGKKIKGFKEFEMKKKLVENALKEIETKLAPGVPAKKLVERTKLLGKIPHALGHGIGLETHDCLTISEKSVWKLEKGMVLAIEPAIYTKKFGVRIENDYLITKKGFKKL